MPLSNPDLWQKIADWPLPYRAERDTGVEPPRDCICFEHNLRKQGDWTDESARRLTEEYRRFLYLKALDGGLLTPPGCVDEVWHLHMTLAGTPDGPLVLPDGQRIDHLTGLDEETSLERYGKALELYEREFDQSPPEDIWPMADYFKDRNRKEIIAWRYCMAGLCLWGMALLLVLIDYLLPGWKYSLFSGETMRTLVSPVTFFILGWFHFGAIEDEGPPYPPKPEKIARCG